MQKGKIMKFYEASKGTYLEPLRKKNLSDDPFLQFELWIEDARRNGIADFNAMSLATASASGKPSCRTVLLKEFDHKGAVFFTNYDSRKGKELAENPYASALFFWQPLMRQISIEGKIIKIFPQESYAYFSQRPRGSQLGAWTSSQGKPIASRNVLEKNLKALIEKYEGKEIPLPDFWGGYRIIPSRFEFWQGGKDRLHDRFSYTLEGESWKIQRLSP